MDYTSYKINETYSLKL